MDQEHEIVDSDDGEYVLLEKGILYHIKLVDERKPGVKEDGDDWHFVKKPLADGEELKLLRDPLRLAPGTLFEDVLEVLKVYEGLAVVCGIYSTCDVEAFLESAEEPIVLDDFDPLDLLEVYWRSDTEKLYEKITHPGGHKERIRTILVDAVPAFHGKGKPEQKEIDAGFPADELIGYSLSFLPLSHMLKVPVVLNTEIVLYEPLDLEEIRAGKTPKRLELKDNFRQFSLFEVFSEILFEISFYGGPEDRNATKNELRDTVDRIKHGEEPLHELDLEALDKGEWKVKDEAKPGPDPASQEKEPEG